ncbi:kappaPI-actitoxin-Avd3c-like [Diorhabda carinulata]|uniref:kappaPI-actitoxin-Avd3c-like n=1 Tax=Diorhabda sublineata TaxID=1163346 RepID=UPI0024E10F22|nr:kappaPI-actitoxin-Avd3c-like [Diorhabda sublineata]XP_057651541.1 kappaPI-actitoxin-Avd3c-like [Diorhabda carinulata]
MFVKFIVFVILFIVTIQSVICKPYIKDNLPIMCHLPEDKGRCRALIPRWRYDPDSKQCKLFNYGGCAGNVNNFVSKEVCIEKCKGT